MGYLQVRDPVVVNCSYFFSFIDDPTIAVSGSSPNVQRGAAMLFAAAEFRKLVVTGQLPYERVGKKKTPICSTAYKYMFNACRIPRREQDSYRIYDPSQNTHCVVARKGHFFSIQLAHPETGNPLPVMELEDQLRQCITLADAIPSSRSKLGLMTSGNRDDWADARQQLVSVGGVAMEEALEKLQSGAILLNLDDEAPISRQECGDLFWTGGFKSGENRWFDKSIEIMVANNGKAGLIAEHSMMDGMPVINFADYVTKMTYAQARQKSVGGDSIHGGVEDIFANALVRMDTTVVKKLETKGWHFSFC
jgi:carnitine O-acetyltransferase